MIPLAVLFITTAVLSWHWEKSLRVQKVVVEGARILSAKQIASLAGVPAKSQLYGVDLFTIRQRLMKQPFIRSVRVNREVPGTLMIEVEEREPVASLGGGQIRYVDAEGMVLPYVNTSIALDLPVISGLADIQEVQAGKIFESEDLAEALELLQTAQQIDSSVYHFISEINMSRGEDVVLYSADVGVPIYFGHGDAARKLLLLQTFWANFVKTGDPDRLRYIDLRYEDQVVVKWNTPPESKGTKASL